MLLQPLHCLGIEVVGRLVEEQDIGLLQQEARERDAPSLASEMTLTSVWRGATERSPSPARPAPQHPIAPRRSISSCSALCRSAT